MNIHPLAVVSPDADLHDSVTIGPFCVIGAGVKIGAGTTVATHTTISGLTTIGENNQIDSYVSLGGTPQDVGYAGEATELVIGDDNQIREYVSIHRGTINGGGKTIIADTNMIMAYAHLGHDCVIGNHVIVVNAAHLSGHTHVDDYATVGGLTGIHQFSKIGTFSFIGGASAVNKDVPPYAMVSGVRGRMWISGINKVGLRRNGFKRDVIASIDAAFRILFHSPTLLHNEALDKAEQALGTCKEVAVLLEFIRSSKRGVVKRIHKS